MNCIIKYRTFCSLLVFLLVSNKGVSQDLNDIGNKRFIAAGYQHRSYEEEFDQDGQHKKSGTYTLNTVNLYSQIPLKNHWKVYINYEALVGIQQQKDEKGNSVSKKRSAIGDGEIGMGYRFKEGEPWQFTAGFLQGIGTGTREQGPWGLNTGYGDYCQYLFGNALFKHDDRYYLSAETGFRNRNKKFTDSWLLKGEAGYRLINCFWLLIKGEGVQPFQNGDKNLRGGTINNGLYSQDAGWLYIEPSLAYYSKYPINIRFSYRHNLKGQFIPDAAVISATLCYSFNKKETAE